MDKRIIKTKNAIKTAFMQLMQQKNADDITVSDIAEAAQINRSTFYLHYSGTEEVKKSIENEIADKITSRMKLFDPNKVYESTYALFTNLTDALDEAAVLKRYLLYSSASKRIISNLKETVVSVCLENFGKEGGEFLDYDLTFLASGIIDCYLKWSYSDEREPLDALCREISRICELIIERIQST